MTYEEIVSYVSKKATKLKAKGEAAVQVDITGEGEGAFYVQTKDGKQMEAHYDRRARSWTTVGGETTRQINDVKFWAIKPPEQPETH